VGFLDRFFGKKDGADDRKQSKEERWVNKQVKKVMNKYGQKEVREEAIHSLAQRGTPEAISGLLKRFSYTHPESIIDEKEKKLVIELLEYSGAERVGEPLRSYLGEENQVSMALIAMDRIEGSDVTVTEIINVLEKASPDDVWNADKKLQMINHLDNYDNAACVEVLLKYLEDLNDDVIFRSIDILERLGTDDQIRDAFIELLIDEDVGNRIRDRLLQTTRSKKWFLGPQRKQLEPLLPDGYYFDKRDNLKHRNR